MDITRAEVDALFRPGSVVAVEYVHRDVVALAIRVAEQGKASHALCCLGGLDIVEATVVGVSETNLHNYLRGNCILTVRSAIPAPTALQAQKAMVFWSARVNDPYDYWMILGSIPVLLSKFLIGLFSKRLAAKAVRHMPNFLASSNLSTCAELAVRGLREFSSSSFIGYFIGNINPEILRTDPCLNTDAVLVAPTLID